MTAAAADAGAGPSDSLEDVVRESPPKRARGGVAERARAAAGAAGLLVGLPRSGLLEGLERGRPAVCGL